jgi:predicted DNA binding protein
MRKLTIEIEPNEMIGEALQPTFELVYSYEVLEHLRIDRLEGISIDLIECIVKETSSMQDLKSLGHMEILSVLKNEGNKYICLVKQEPKISKDLFKKFDIDFIYTTPQIFSNDKHTYSIIADQENISKFIEQIKKVGRVINMSFQKAAYQQHDLLSVLTDKQREILIAAQKYGYYDYPKKIHSDQLSKKFNITKTTLVQHLRKAEGRIMENIVAGY